MFDKSKKGSKKGVSMSSKVLKQIAGFIDIFKRNLSDPKKKDALHQKFLSAVEHQMEYDDLYDHIETEWNEKINYNETE